MSVQLSSATLEVLKNFATINSGLMFTKGTKQRTISSTKTVFAEAILDEDLPASFGIYDLNNLLAVLTFDAATPTLSYDDPVLKVKFRDTEVTKFRCCKPEMLVLPPNKELDLGVCDVEFDLSSEVLSRILKSASILASPNIVVESDGTDITLSTFDTANDSSHQYSCTIAPGEGKKYRMVFRTENWKMLPGSYRVSLSSKGIAKFVNTARSLTYWLALETGAKTK